MRRAILAGNVKGLKVLTTQAAEEHAEQMKTEINYCK